MQLSVVRNFILKGYSDDSREWIFSHRCSWIAVYVFYRNAQSESHSDPHDIYVCYLYSINCPTVICLPSILLFILWRDTTSELWTPVQYPLHCYYRLLLLALFTFLNTITFYHSIRSILCLLQTGEIDNLIVSWGQSSWLCCVQVPCCYWWKASRAAVRSIAKLASITFWSLTFSYWFDKPWFYNWGKLAVVLLIPFSWGSQLGALTPHHQCT
jgi:hypothetical protein